MNPILLDTHVAVWSAVDRLPKSISNTIEQAAQDHKLLLSPVSAWEIALLTSKGRLNLIAPLGDFISALYSGYGVITATFTPAIAAAAVTLPGELHRDPVDRILIATAAAYGAELVTRDRNIIDYAKKTKHIRCIKC